MKPKIGLYYPLIHFKDEDWLKASALYWDKMGRIVPHGYETPYDTETVKRLSGELDFIQNFNPREWCGPLCDAFAKVIDRHCPALQNRYHVEKRDEWGNHLIFAASAPPNAEPNLAYIFGGKMEPQFVDQLVQAGLGVRGESDGLLQVGMHPRLASVYMTALAAQTAEDAELHPLTDETIDHVALGGWTVERLAQGLLSDELALPKAPILEDELETQLASIAIESVVPKDLHHVDVGKIIQLRKDRREELSAFQNWIHSFVPPLLDDLGDMKSREALKAHLTAVVERDITPRLARFREQLEGVGIETVRGALNIKLTAPKLLAGAAAALGFALNPIVAATAGLAVGVFDVALKARKQADELTKDSPAAYLMHLDEGLQPRTVLGWIREKVRKFSVGQ